MIGEFAALTAAFLWALSSVIYRFLGNKIPALQLNLFKGVIAVVLILLTILIQPPESSSIDAFPWALLALSGLIGIGLGDTAFFLALNQIGARKTLVLETLAPPLSAFLAFLAIGETISLLSWCGILLTLLGVMWVISERNPEDNRKNRKYGIVWAVLAAIAQSVGAVLSRMALLDSDISPLQSSLIRLIAGLAIAFILTLIPFFKTQQTLDQTIRQLTAKTWGIITLAATGSTYLGIWLQQTAFKYAPAGIAQTLLATSPLFIIAIALIMKEKVSWRSFMGVIIAIAGIALLFIAR